MNFQAADRVTFMFDEERKEGTIFRNLGNHRFEIIGTDGNQYEISEKNLSPISYFSNEKVEKKESSIKHFNLARTLEVAKDMVTDEGIEVVESIIKHDRQSNYEPGKHTISIEIILKETE